MAYAPADTSLFSKRGLILVLIVALHVAFFWGLNSGMSRGLIQKILGPIETRIIPALPEPEEAPPPPPPPTIETPPPFVPLPDVAIEIPPEAPPTTAPTMTTSERPMTPPAPSVAPTTSKKAVSLPQSDRRRPLTQPEYPPASKRAGEEGTVTLDIYVLANGRIGDVRIKKSSGFPRLDEAAVREVKSSWRLQPGTEDGKPVEMWGQFAVTFRLTDE
jgi:periplasmic protein TonB